MKNILVNYKGELIIYFIIFIIALFLSMRFESLNKDAKVINNSYSYEIK